MNRTIEVELRTKEMDLADKIAKIRRENSPGFDDWSVGDKRLFGIEKLQARAQLAVAKVYGFDWNPDKYFYESYNKMNLPFDCEVRTTPNRGLGMNVLPRDDEDLVLIFVTSSSFIHKIQGWCFAGQVKKKSFRASFSGGSNKPYFMVPKSELHHPKLFHGAIDFAESYPEWV